MKKGVARDQRLVAAIVDEPADRIVDADHLEHADPALEAGAVAKFAADRLVYDRSDLETEPGCERLRCLNRLTAGRAEPAHQPLRDHRAQGGGEEEGFDLHVAHSRDRADGIVRSEEQTSELQSLMRISDAVFC